MSPGDGLVLREAKKIAPTVEDRTLRLPGIKPSGAARELATSTRGDPRKANLILRELHELARFACAGVSASGVIAA